MHDVLSQEIAAPVEVTIGGKTCRLSYPMHAVGLYQRETARIERSRPRPPEPDPLCLCGAPKSQHTGRDLIRLGEGERLLCYRFRYDDPLRGDSLFRIESWDRIDLEIDAERWLACLWVGLHELQTDGTWKAPYTLAELGKLIPLGPPARDLATSMSEALTAWMPRRKPEADSPNVPAAEIPPPPTNGAASASAAANSAVSGSDQTEGSASAAPNS